MRAAEHLLSALLAGAAAGGHAEAVLQLLERRATRMRLARDVAVAHSMAHTNDHGQTWALPSRKLEWVSL
jgi:hypothetical protein